MAPRCLAATLLATLAALAFASPAAASRDLVVGVVDDWVKWRADTPGIVRVQREAGFDTAKVTFPWQPGQLHPGGYGRCWDVVHAMRPDVNVISSTAPRHGPLEFLRRLGAAKAASLRTRPIVDTFGHNPYPLFASELPGAVHDSGYIGQGDYPALVETLEASFKGTPRIWYLENGFQTTSPVRGALYHGQETESEPLRAGDQARQLVEAPSSRTARSLTWARSSTSSSRTSGGSAAGSPACCGRTGGRSPRSSQCAS